jgi:ribosome-associated protein
LIKLTKPRSSRSLAVTIGKIAQSKLANNILILDLRKIDMAPADFFVVCSSTSTTHTKAIFDEVYYQVKELDQDLPKSEGLDTRGWVLIDYFDVVVNIMTEEARSYYKLEKLWSDAKFMTLDEEATAISYSKNNLNELYVETADSTD